MDPSNPAPAAPAPGGDGGAPAPAPAPAAPTQPAAPGTDPIAPSQPNTPVNQLTADEQAQKFEDDEWAAAEKQIFPGLKKPKGAKDEPAKPAKTPEEIAADEAAAKDKKPDAEPGAGDDAGAKDKDPAKNGDEPDEPATPDTTARDARHTAREVAQQTEAMKTDVRSKMFADVPETLQDADGDPIHTIDDVMKLINPRTGETFTEEEAGSWLLSAQQQFNKQLEQVDKAIASIAELNLDIKDQADAVNFKYGAWLKAHPEKRDELWAEFQETLQKDPESGIIVGMPYALEKFYERALAPLVTNEAEAARVDEEKKAAEAKAAAEKKAEEEKQRQNNRAGRSDIYQPPADPKGADPEDEEWDQAHTAVFGNQLPKK